MQERASFDVDMMQKDLTAGIGDYG